MTHVLGILEHKVDGVRTPDAQRIQGIQLFGDRLFAATLSKQLKDLLDGRGFLGDHRQAISDGHALPSRIGVASRIVHRFGAVSVGPAPGRVSLEELTIEATLRGFPEIVKVELIDEALHRHADLGILVSRVEPVRYRDNSDSEEAKSFDNGVGVADIAGEPRELVDDDCLELGGSCTGRPDRFL